MLKIESRKNQKIKQFLNLLNSKNARKKQGLCTLEGWRLISDALRFNVKFKQIFVNSAMLEKLNSDQSPLLSACQLNLISDALMNQISSVKNSQGIFAVVEKPSSFQLNSIPPNNNVLILVELSDPGNLGTLIRSAAAFGFTTIVLVNCCDIYNSKALRSSMSSIFQTKILECSIAELINWLTQTSLKTVAAVSNTSNQSIELLKDKPNCALLIGNEANGLPDKIVSICKSKITIKMQNGIESLNAAVAGSILMFCFSHKTEET